MLAWPICFGTHPTIFDLGCVAATFAVFWYCFFILHSRTGHACQAMLVPGNVVGCHCAARKRPRDLIRCCQRDCGISWGQMIDRIDLPQQLKLLMCNLYRVSQKLGIPKQTVSFNTKSWSNDVYDLGVAPWLRTPPNLCPVRPQPGKRRCLERRLAKA